MEDDQKKARYLSPLRYPGGKGKVANFLKLLLAKNSLCGATYVEPYAGGASVALSLLFDGYVSKIQINDLNMGVYNFWRLVLHAPDALCTKIQKVPLSIKEWQRQKAVYADPSSSPEELGFATFYLNRTNRSGIIARGGVIGGNEQEGKWKIDARFNRSALCDRVNSIAEWKAKIEVTRQDAVDLLASSNRKEEKRFFYLDPPYYVKGSRLYDNFYEHNDHLKISTAIKTLKSPWVVSYDSVTEIMKMYPNFRNMKYQLGYSASKVAMGSEVMFFSPDLKLPAVDSPAAVKARDLAM